MDINRKHIFPPSLIVTIKYCSLWSLRGVQARHQKNVLVFVFCCLDGFVMFFFLATTCEGHFLS